jgi:hypothetical protein
MMRIVYQGERINVVTERFRGRGLPEESEAEALAS